MVEPDISATIQAASIRSMGQLLPSQVPFHDIAEVLLFHATPVAPMTEHPNLALVGVARDMLMRWNGEMVSPAGRCVLSS